MQLTVPITGTVIREGDIHDDGLLEGDPNDPIRLIDINLGNVSWTLVDIDIDAEVAIIEVTPALDVVEETGVILPGGEPEVRQRDTTDVERSQLLSYAKGIVEGKTKAQLHTLSGSPRIKRPNR